ncbi:MAG: extracellular solute-binding protein, partial [Candidatus Omnitrophota bacterium]
MGCCMLSRWCNSYIGGILFLLFLLNPISIASASPEKTTLTLWEFSADEALLRKFLQQFEKTHPGIQVNVQQLSWEQGLEKIVIAIAGRNAPDVVELGTDWVSKFTDARLLQDLTQETGDLRKDHFLWESVTWKNKVYGIPWLAGTRILFYHRGLFRKAGLDPDRPPETWADLLEAAEKIRGLGEDVYGFSIFVGEPYSPWQEFLPFAWGNGASLLSEDGKHALLDSPAMVEALRFYQKLKPYSLVDRQSQVNTLFANGNVGMQISGSWNFRLIQRLNPQLDFGTALLPKPAADRGLGAAFAGGEILA